MMTRTVCAAAAFALAIGAGGCTGSAGDEAPGSAPPVPRFEDGGRALGEASSSSVVLADVDGDGDLDAAVANEDAAGELWLNDGAGRFTAAAAGFPAECGIALGDLDGDGDPDAFLCCGETGDRIYLNNGRGGFADTGQRLGESTSFLAVLGDLDGDGDLDAVVTSWEDRPRTVWLNDGAGRFAAAGPVLASAHYLHGVAAGDLDGDGDLDLFCCDNATAEHEPVPNRVWMNDGSGRFADSGQRLGTACSYEAALGDLDGDGDLDAFVANSSHAGADPVNRVWLNDGAGRFADSGQGLGEAYSMYVALADLDGDGDLDAYVTNYKAPDRVWINDGAAGFTDSGLRLGDANGSGVALGDLDGDGDLDAFVVNNTWQGGAGANRVYFNHIAGRGGRGTR